MPTKIVDGVRVTMPQSEHDALFPPKSLDEIKADREVWAAEYRWRQESAGIVWTRADGKSYGISTDERSTGKLLAERTAAKDGLRGVGDPWKCLDVALSQNVFLALTDAEVEEVADAARAHALALFKKEGAFVAAIRAATSAAEVAAVEF